MRWFIGGLAVLVAIAAGVYIVASVQFDRERAASLREGRRMLALEREQTERLRQEAAAAPDAGTPARLLPATLARLVADPAAATPSATAVEGELDKAVYFVDGFARAELQRVKGHPEAWSWLLLEPRGVETDDFGPPGSVRDLLSGAPAQIGGFPVHGVIHRVTAGPLAGAILLYNPPGMVGPPLYQVATVAFHQRTGSFVMDSLCDLGQVPGVPADVNMRFKDECFAQVAHRLGRRVDDLFPSPWMIRTLTSPTCDRSLGGAIEGWTYECRWQAKTGKTSVAVKRGRRD